MKSNGSHSDKNLSKNPSHLNRPLQADNPNLRRIRRLRNVQEPQPDFISFNAPSKPENSSRRKNLSNIERIREAEEFVGKNFNPANSRERAFSRDSKNVLHTSNPRRPPSLRIQTPTNNKTSPSNIFITSSSLKNMHIVSPIINAREPYQSHITNTSKKPIRKASSTLLDSLSAISDKNGLDSRSLLGFTPNNFYVTPDMTPKPPSSSEYFLKRQKLPSPETPQAWSNILSQNSNLFLENKLENNSLVPTEYRDKYLKSSALLLVFYLREQASQRKSLFAYKSALHFYKLAYLFLKSETDLVEIIDILVKTGDYGQADSILFSDNLILSEFKTNCRLDLARLGITISIRLNKYHRIGYLNQLIQKYQSSNLGLNQNEVENSNFQRSTSADVPVFKNELERQKKGQFFENNKNITTQESKRSDLLDSKFPQSLDSINLNYSFLKDGLDLDSEREFKQVNPPLNNHHVEPNTNSNNRLSISKGWDWYICGMSILQSNSILGWENSISALEAKNQPCGSIALQNFSTSFETPSNKISALNKRNKKHQYLGKSSILKVVTMCWKEAVFTDPKCTEAWAGLRNYGLLSVFEEMELIQTIDWASFFDENVYVSSFFKNYSIISGFPFSHHKLVQEAYDNLLRDYPQITNESNFKLSRAERLLTGCQPNLAVSFLQDLDAESAAFINQYNSIDDGSNVILLASWVQTRSKELIFAKTQYLIDYFGLSSILDSRDRQANDSLTPRYSRLRENSLANGAYHPSNEHMSTLETVWNILDSTSEADLKPHIPNTLRRLATVKSSCSAMRSGQSNSVVGVEPLKLDACIDTASVYSNSLYSFKLSDGLLGESLCYFAIGCYYLTCSLKNQEAYMGDDEKELDFEFNGDFQKKNFASIIPIDKSLLEARRWFAKATIYAPLSVVSWLSFAYTFYAVYDYDRAIQAASSAVIASNPANKFSGAYSSSNELDFLSAKNKSVIKNTNLGRNSHLPLLCLGTLFICTYDFAKSENCLEASIYSLLGLDSKQVYTEHLIPLLQSKSKDLNKSKYEPNNTNKSYDRVFLAFDVVLFNEIGVLKLKQNKIQEAIVWISVALYCSLDIGQNKDIGDQAVSFCLNLSHCYKAAKSYKKALKFANMALSFDANHIDALLTLAYLYYYMSLSLPENDTDTCEHYDMFEDFFNEFDETGQQKMIRMCIDLCHQILYISPYNYIAAELLEMSLEHAASESFISNIGRIEPLKNSAETELKLAALDGYLSSILEEPPIENRSAHNKKTKKSSKQTYVQLDQRLNRSNLDLAERLFHDSPGLLGNGKTRNDTYFSSVSQDNVSLSATETEGRANSRQVSQITIVDQYSESNSFNQAKYNDSDSNSCEADFNTTQPYSVEGRADSEANFEGHAQASNEVSGTSAGEADTDMDMDMDMELD